MIIGISALGALSQDTGGRTYIVNLSQTLQNIVTDHTFIFFMSPGESHILNLNHPDFRVVEVSHSKDSYRRILTENIVLPYLIKKNKINVMYYPGNFSSYYCPVPYILAIRSMLVYNQEAGEKVSHMRQMYRKFFMPHSASNAHHIITPSQHTKQEIMKFLKVDADKITVIPHGIDTKLFGSPKDESKAVPYFEQYHIKQPFLLYVSALWEYKNQDKLILAFAKLVKERQIDHHLVLIGRGMTAFESYGAKLRLLVSELDLNSRIFFIDFLPHEVLKHFYQNADVFVFPSLMESFGNPLYEAMSAGVPVVCSNTHGFPSMVKDAAAMADPRNIPELADTIYKVISEPEMRTKLVSNGKSLSDSLTWKVCVERTLSHILNIKDSEA